MTAESLQPSLRRSVLPVKVLAAAECRIHPQTPLSRRREHRTADPPPLDRLWTPKVAAMRQCFLCSSTRTAKLG